LLPLQDSRGFSPRAHQPLNRCSRSDFESGSPSAPRSEVDASHRSPKNNSSEDRFLLNQWILQSTSYSSSLAWAKLLIILRRAQNPSTLKKVFKLQSYAVWCDTSLPATGLDTHIHPVDLLDAAEHLDMDYPALVLPAPNKFIRESRYKIQEHCASKRVEQACFDLYRLSGSAYRYSTSVFQRWRALASGRAFSGVAIQRSWRCLTRSVDQSMNRTILMKSILQYKALSLPVALDNHSYLSSWTHAIGFRQ
jgi:hypothetical protein